MPPTGRADDELRSTASYFFIVRDVFDVVSWVCRKTTRHCKCFRVKLPFDARLFDPVVHHSVAAILARATDRGDFPVAAATWVRPIPDGATKCTARGATTEGSQQDAC